MKVQTVTFVTDSLDSLGKQKQPQDQKNQEKMMHRRNKRIKQFKDKQLKQNGMINRLLTDFTSRSAARIQKSAGQQFHMIIMGVTSLIPLHL